jgi:hypothetical protein
MELEKLKMELSSVTELKNRRKKEVETRFFYTHKNASHCDASI